MEGVRCVRVARDARQIGKERLPRFACGIAQRLRFLDRLEMTRGDGIFKNKQTKPFGAVRSHPRRRGQDLTEREKPRNEETKLDRGKRHAGH